MRAIWWNVKNIRASIKKRMIVQKMRVVSDDELFKFIMKPFNFKEMLSHFIKVESNFK
jgi:hypothetical protein